MGLMIYSLDNVPQQADRDYFVYLLDYGWDEPIANSMKYNFDKMAEEAANNRAVVIKGLVGSHFVNEVFSWHHINGEDGENVLPAILITNATPQYFQSANFSSQKGLYREDTTGEMKLILIPLKKFCSGPAEAVDLIDKLFSDIKNQNDLTDFQIVKEIKRGSGGSLVDSIILQPNIGGIGVDLKKLIGIFSKS